MAALLEDLAQNSSLSSAGGSLDLGGTKFGTKFGTEFGTKFGKGADVGGGDGGDVDTSPCGDLDWACCNADQRSFLQTDDPCSKTPNGVCCDGICKSGSCGYVHTLCCVSCAVFCMRCFDSFIQQGGDQD